MVGARWPVRLNFVPWCLTCLVSQYGTSFSMAFAILCPFRILDIKSLSSQLQHFWILVTIIAFSCMRSVPVNVSNFCFKSLSVVSK